MVDFNKAIENVQKLPSTEEGKYEQPSIPDPFENIDPRKIIGEQVSEEDEGTIPNAYKLNMEFHCARLQMGPVERGFEHGQAVLDDQDDSARLKEIMDLQMQGKATVLTKKETFLKTGGVVIWLEWMTYVDPPAKKDRDWLTETELRTPSPMSSSDTKEGDED